LQLPAVFCNKNDSCPFNMLFTGQNRSFAQSIFSFSFLLLCFRFQLQVIFITCHFKFQL
jgi:hypothetical protein